MPDPGGMAADLAPAAPPAPAARGSRRLGRRLVQLYVGLALYGVSMRQDGVSAVVGQRIVREAGIPAADEQAS